MKTPVRLRIFAVFSLAFGLYVLVSDDLAIKWRGTDKVAKVDQKRKSPPNEIDLRGTEMFGTCKLPLYNPFYGRINKTIKYFDPMSRCVKNFEYITSLVNGSIFINKKFAKGYKCSARCTSTDERPTDGPWQDLKRGANPINCQFIGTRCVNENNEAEYCAHSQFLPHEEDEEKQEDTEETEGSKEKKENSDIFKPDVHIVLLDSVGSTQALRSLPNTIDFLKRKMGAVVFNHLNKVGENSRPNGFALSMGWRIATVKRAAVGAEDLEPVYPYKVNCKTYKDDTDVIFKQYGRDGYKTLYSEDYPAGTIYTWPSCLGFKENPTNHSFRPFLHILNQAPVWESLRKSKCYHYQIYREAMNYTRDFINSYTGKPKFSFTWITTISHDSANRLFHTDVYFEQFFRDIAPNLRNSFVIFMSDHGLRYGQTRWTEVGRVEVNNPFLMMVVPERLRSNKQLMQNLNENAYKLLTQYDVYATLVDILKFAPEDNFTSFNFKEIIANNQNNETSILRPLGKYDNRTCRTLPVSASHCLCEFDREPIHDEHLMEILSEFLIKEINKMIKEDKATKLCPKLSLLKPITVFKFVGNNTEFGLYIVLAKATPGGGKFRGTIRYEHATGKLLNMDVIQRTNRYGSRGDCVKHIPHLRPFCYCSL